MNSLITLFVLSISSNQEKKNREERTDYNVGSDE